MSAAAYWVAYDISNDRERTRVERTLSRYGSRLQKSVFRCVLDRARCERLLQELERLAIKSGQVVCVPVQERFAASVGLPLPPSESWSFAVSE